MTEPLAHTAFLFPGQGSQAVGMGKDLAERYDTARHLFQRADDILGFPLSTVCFQGPEEELRKTETTQPALYVTSCAVLEVLRERGIGTPESVAGHSLGEYSALYAAGVFDFETGLRLVRARGEAMYAAGQKRLGSMAAVLGLEGQRVAEICQASSDAATIVVAANFNAPDQTVISGDVAAVERATAALQAAGAKRVISLPVSGAFHTPLVRPASDAMRQRLAEVSLQNADGVQFLNNAEAEILRDAGTIRASLVRQVVLPVRWAQILERLGALGTRRFVEVGSGKVLAGLVRRMHRDAEVLTTESVTALEATVAALKP